MRAFPDIPDRGAFEPLIIRTDYNDEHAWHAVKAALAEPVEVGDEVSTCPTHIVDNPSWAGATVDEVLAAVAVDNYLDIVFLADRTTMQDDHHALLAVTTATREVIGDDGAYNAMIEFGREFRTEPMGVHEIHTNLALANMDFEEFSGAAHEDPEGVYRSLWHK